MAKKVKKTKKKRAHKYEEKLAIGGSLDDVLAASVAPSKEGPPKKTKK